jgi:DNA polymerase III subunit gamma/tau
MATLYRQYRPQRFGEIEGQEHITKTLGRAVENDKLAHAYLFHGPRGTGKTTTARILAKRLNCQQPEGAEPCGKCKHCVAVQEGRAMDIIEIDAASNRSIDDILALQEGISLSPGMGNYKVYIIDEVHMLSGPAFTALLKTLEEPVKHAVFILATTEFHKVPDTILSRCQVFRFRRASYAQMQKRLKFLLAQEKREANEAALSLLINRSDGCYRDAESLLGQVLAVYDGNITEQHLNEFLGMPPKEVLEQFLSGLVKGESALALKAIDDSFAQGFDPEQLLQESILTAREGLLALIREDENLPFEFTKLPNARKKLVEIMRALLQAIQDLAYVPQPLVAVQLAIVTVCTDKGLIPEKVQPTPQQEKPKPSSTISKAVDVNMIKQVWPRLIEEVRKTNPVGSTFLRAMEPVGTSGNIIKLRAGYALHFNFLNKQENKMVLEKALSELLQMPLVVQCSLEEKSLKNETEQKSQMNQETELLETVKEAFG